MGRFSDNELILVTHPSILVGWNYKQLHLLVVRQTFKFDKKLKKDDQPQPDKQSRYKGL